MKLWIKAVALATITALAACGGGPTRRVVADASIGSGQSVQGGFVGGAVPQLGDSRPHVWTSGHPYGHQVHGVDVSKYQGNVNWGAARNAGIGVEIIDVRTLVPLDLETVLASVEKTGRVVIVTEAPRTAGFHSEIAANIAEEAIDYLQAPIVRVTGFDAPYPPFTAIEDVYRPNPLRVAKAIKKVMSH